jgi:hypothetical protein
VDLPPSLFPEGRENTLPSRQKAPLGVENLHDIRRLRTIRPSGPAAELSLSFGAGRGIGSGIRHRPLARLSIMKSHLIIEIITLRPYIRYRSGRPKGWGPGTRPGMDDEGILRVHHLIASEHELFPQGIQPSVFNSSHLKNPRCGALLEARRLPRVTASARDTEPGSAHRVLPTRLREDVGSVECAKNLHGASSNHQTRCRRREQRACITD